MKIGHLFPRLVYNNQAEYLIKQAQPRLIRILHLGDVMDRRAMPVLMLVIIFASTG